MPLNMMFLGISAKTFHTKMVRADLNLTLP
uniref:Uncharacterized protein n=1 Tax=Anguilla anguilla TaxID=7936 RepID=A0A0E9XBP2_ANGAN